MKSQKNKSLYFILCVISLSTSSIKCRKFVEIPSPPNLIADGNVFGNDATANAVMAGIYTDMSKPSVGQGVGSFTGIGGISLITGLSSDELTLYSGVTANNYKLYYTNGLSVSTASASAGFEFWPKLYNYIYRCNAAIEGLSSSVSNSLTPSIKQQLLGEARFLRAFFYFYLTNLYGDVPLLTSTDYKINLNLSRASTESVLQQIISDLKDAQVLLSSDFLGGDALKTTQERVRPSKWAATALLARAYLYIGEWTNAELHAGDIISNSSLFSLSTLGNAFLKASMGNREAIWQLQPVTTGHNTEDGWIFNLPSTGPSDISGSLVYPAYLTDQLLNSFEKGDMRYSNWIKSVSVNGKSYSYPYKYRSATLNAPVTEYFMVFRLAEQLLIRAEARAQQNKIPEGLQDVNKIRNRAGLSDTTATNKDQLLAVILHERQVELFTEWGHRWFDLKRTKNIDAIMNTATPLKSGSSWQSYQQLYPIPLGDLNSAPNLSQNSGY